MKGQNRPISKQERIDINLLKDLKKIQLNRVINGLEDCTIPIREVSRMIPNTENWDKVVHECCTKPRRKDV
jgi:hypothetical protein